MELRLAEMSAAAWAFGKSSVPVVEIVVEFVAAETESDQIGVAHFEVGQIVVGQIVVGQTEVAVVPVRLPAKTSVVRRAIHFELPHFETFHLETPRFELLHLGSHR